MMETDLPNTPTSSSQAGSDRGGSAPFFVPPTPVLKKIGYGAGVGVFHMDRSPCSGMARSPWALKKVLKKPARKSFIGSRLRSEADLLKKLNHPNIVGFRGFSKTNDGREVLAMEECEQCLGTILENRYENREGPLEAALIVRIVYEISKALQYIHNEHKIIHGDMKSYNILIKGNYDSIKLCDFGVSFPLNENGVALDYVGTEVWNAPEAFADGPITPKADIFSLGLTIWEMVCLMPPHTECPENGSESMNLDESLEVTENYGTRPPFPELGPEYDLVKHLFFWFTEENYSNRPSTDEIIAFLHTRTL